MKGIKKWVTKTAFNQTVERLEMILAFGENNGISPKIQDKAMAELANLKKLRYGSDARQQQIETLTERLNAFHRTVYGQKEKDSN